MTSMIEAQKEADRRTAAALLSDAIDSLERAGELYRKAGDTAKAITIAGALATAGKVADA